jgi:hypothetical protein
VLFGEPLVVPADGLIEIRIVDASPLATSVPAPPETTAVTLAPVLAETTFVAVDDRFRFPLRCTSIPTRSSPIASMSCARCFAAASRSFWRRPAICR